MRRIGGGDPAAFDNLYERHAARLLGLLVCLLPQRADAEDVLQETFWQVWNQAGRYDSARGSVEVWLNTIARSRGLDHQRRRQGPPESAVAQAGAPADPLRALEQSETMREVRQALTRLPAEQRQALSLAFFGGLTHEQVATRQGVPLGTAKTRIRLAMSRLRALFQEEIERVP